MPDSERHDDRSERYLGRISVSSAAILLGIVAWAFVNAYLG